MSLVGKGLCANKLIGRSVINDEGETIGKIDDIVITEDQKLYVPLQVGGFLGIGSHLVVVPYDSLQFDETERKILLPKVILKGKVRYWAGHDEAERAAWRAPGITNVDDRIVVSAV